MMKKNFTRRGFISRATAGVAGAGVASGITSLGLVSCTSAVHEVSEGKSTASGFAQEVERLLPLEIQKPNRTIRSNHINFRPVD